MSESDQFLERVVARIDSKHRPVTGEYSPATKLLLADLERCRTENNKVAIGTIIANAKAEQYNRFLSESLTPAADLDAALRRAGLHTLVEAADNGRYD